MLLFLQHKLLPGHFYNIRLDVSKYHLAHIKLRHPPNIDKKKN